jgi:lipid-A-disaccharide synthase
VACFRPAQRERVEREMAGLGLPIEAHSGRTAEIIHLAHACIAVSGSVGLELLYRGKPSCIIYRIRPFELRVGKLFKMVPYISLVNLLGDKELIPEFLTDRCEAEAISRHVLRWLDEPEEYDRVCRELALLRERVAEPGACDRAARHIVDVLNDQAQAPIAA